MYDTITDSEYNKLLEKARVEFKYQPHVDPNDVVNDIVVEAMEKGEPLYFHLLVKKVRAKFTGNFVTRRGLINGARISKSEQNRVCSRCKDCKPISAFYIVRRYIRTKGDVYDVVKEVLYNCITCCRELAKEQAKKRKENEKYLLASRKAIRKYQAKKRASQTPKQKREYNAKMRAYRQTPEWKAYMIKYKEKQKAKKEGWL